MDAERAVTDVLLVSAGDIFSGNPIVDQHSEKGFPIIDIMNKTGFYISVLGNHEFDYGLSVLNDRIEQAEFEWVCANLDAQSSVLSQPDPYSTLTVGDLKITFLGLVETEGKPTDTIPSTHPWRVADISFQKPLSYILKPSIVLWIMRGAIGFLGTIDGVLTIHPLSYPCLRLWLTDRRW